MAKIELKNINKIYDNKVQAVFDFNLEIEDKELIVLVGPSGCGKSTTLRMIAGLEEISSGDFKIDDKLMNDVEPKDRDIAMVFQSYALYPHMSVFDNMAFGLKLRKLPKDEIKKRVEEAAEILGLSEYLKRKPKALSGGQRQRVALGRAIVREAKVFLMDEPLSNLDAKLRGQMRAEITKLHNKLGTTTIYVTHDQTEAMTMASRIVVMNKGYIQQVGTPEEIYENPSNLFVAGFTGSPAMNFVNGTVEGKFFVVGDQKLPLNEENQKSLESYQGKEVIMGVRPESVKPSDRIFRKFPETTVSLPIEVSELLGHAVIAHLNYGGQKLISNCDVRKFPKDDAKELEVAFDLDKIYFFDKDSEERIY